MSAQERLDAIENLILSAAGTVKVFNLMEYMGHNQALISTEDLLGDALQEVLELKKEPGLTSNLSIVEGEVQHE